MKLTVSLLASLLACGTAARPRAMTGGDLLEQKSRITAFVVDAKGNPSVECWEIARLAESSQVQRADGTKATANVFPLANAREIDGLDILTWPSSSDIWPPPSGSVQAEYLDLSNTFNLFNVQSGLINFNFYLARFGAMAGQNDDDDEVETHIFSLENGDDWFYFEDSTPGSLAVGEAPFEISTISATETELLRLRYNSQPKHRVIHKGACKFTGIETPEDSSSATDQSARSHLPVSVQVHIEDL